MNEKTTIDDFFDGKLKIIQPAEGFRAGSDAVLLSAVAPACDGKLLDVGCGVGTASLCFSHNNKKATITSIDVQEDLLALAKKNIELNNIDNIEIKKINICEDKPDYQTYDAVITNPPFFKDGHGIKSPSFIKQTANTGTVDLGKWIDFCFLSLKDKGDLTIIFIADRLSELLCLMNEKFGDIEVVPLYPRADQDAKRIIVKAKKNTKGVTKLRAGIILHKEDGSSNIDEILREGKRYDC